VPSAIPTDYAGVRFRSRLEARWAALFDALDWPWAYEPLDLEGYVPDFVLPLEVGGRPAPLLVEVKPALYYRELEEHEAHAKIARSGWEGDWLVVGASLHWPRLGAGPRDCGLLVGTRTWWLDLWAVAGNAVQWRRR